MPQVGSYDRVFALVAACQKYETVSIQSYIRAELNRRTFHTLIEAKAFSVYAIAGGMQLIQEMSHPWSTHDT